MSANSKTSTPRGLAGWIGRSSAAAMPRRRLWETVLVFALAQPSSAFWTAPSDRSHVRAALALPEAPARRALAEAGNRTTGADWRSFAARSRAERSARRAILFVHVSKSGGTSLCMAATRGAGCHDVATIEATGLERCARGPAPNVTGDKGAAFAFGLNCWSRWLGDGPIWKYSTSTNNNYGKKGDGRRTCAARLAYVGSVRANLLALESYAPGLDARAFAAASGAPPPAVAARLALSAPSFDARDAVCGRDFVTVLVVREPLERIHSHFQNIVQVLRDDPDANFPPSRVFADADAAGLPRFAARWLATRLNHVADNLYVRTLLGRAAYDLPFGAVGPDHERAALEVLQAIDWVLPLSSPHAGLVLADGLGWRSAAARAHLETNRKARTARFAPFDADEAEWLAAINRHDYALYDQARALHALDVEALRSLQRHAPERAAPEVLAPDDGRRCCGFSCQPACGTADEANSGSVSSGDATRAVRFARLAAFASAAVLVASRASPGVVAGGYSR